MQPVSYVTTHTQASQISFTSPNTHVGKPILFRSIGGKRNGMGLRRGMCPPWQSPGPSISGRDLAKRCGLAYGACVHACIEDHIVTSMLDFGMEA